MPVHWNKYTFSWAIVCFSFNRTSTGHSNCTECGILLNVSIHFIVSFKMLKLVLLLCLFLLSAGTNESNSVDLCE